MLIRSVPNCRLCPVLRRLCDALVDVQMMKCTGVSLSPQVDEDIVRAMKHNDGDRNTERGSYPMSSADIISFFTS